jgi:hypothetical protein
MLQKLSQKQLDLFIAFLIAFLLIALKVQFLSLPLNGDENYYAIPFNWNYILDLSSKTFGHPPGWPIFLNVGYLLFGYSATLVHSLSLLCSSMLMGYLFLLLKPFLGRLLSLLVVVAIANHHYYILASSLSHPVIVCSLLGLCSLIHLNKGEYGKYAFFVCLALLVRESALIFPFAALIAYPKKKTLFSSSIGLLLLGSFYALHYFMTDRVLLNSQMEYLLEIGQPVLIFSFSRIIRFFTEQFFYSWYFASLAFTSVGLVVLTKSVSIFKENRLVLSTLIAGSSHALFFSTYTHWAARDIFMSTVVLMVCFFIILHNLSLNRVLNKKLFKMVCSLFLVFYIIRPFVLVFDEGGEVGLMKEDSFAFQRLGIELTSLRRTHPKSSILIGYPISIYLSEPFMGYVERSIRPLFFGGRDGSPLNDPPDFVVFYKAYETKVYVDYVNDLVKRIPYKVVYSETLNPDRVIKVLQKP